MSINKKGVIAVVLGLAVAFGAYKWLFSKSESDIVSQYKVERKRIEKSISAQGMLEPLSYVDLGSQVSGQIVKIHVELGDKVKKGQLLLEIDPTTYAARVEQDRASIKKLEADLKSRKLSLELAEDQFKREEELFKSGFSSQETYDAARINYRKAEADIESLNAQISQSKSTLKQNESNLSYTKIYSSMDGTVVSLPVKVGQTINASMSTPNIMQIAKLDIMTVKAQVSEADISNITDDMKMYFTTLGDSERKWYGKVRMIEPTPDTSTSNVVLYNVLADVENPGGELKISMSVQAYFIEAEADNALVVPISYVRRDKDRVQYVNVIDAGDKITKKTIKTGVSTRLEVEITEGIKEGDKLAVVSNGAASSGSSANQRGGSMGRMRF